MTNAIVIDPRLAIMPVMEIGDAIARRQMFVDYVRTIMVDGTDYGTIPGASKPSLQKPGAEKLASFFGLTPDFEDVTAIEDWMGAEHGGEPFFYYRLRCHLYRGERRIASADGSCNSWETKYRYRKADRVCPNCGQPTIMRSKYPPKDNPNATPGWYCNAKAGGCGGSFPATDPGIADQVVGRIPNPDPAEQVNTFLKIAQKRALVAAVLIAVNASEFFTQDIEDMATTDYRIVDTETGEVTTPPAPKNSKPTSQPATPAPAPMTEGQRKRLHALGATAYGPDWDANRHRLVKAITKGRSESSTDLTEDEAAALIRGIEKKLDASTVQVGEQAPDFPAPGDLHPASAHLEATQA